jgi:hypothetical protein
MCLSSRVEEWVDDLEALAVAPVSIAFVGLMVSLSHLTNIAFICRCIIIICYIGCQLSFAALTGY